MNKPSRALSPIETRRADDIYEDAHNWHNAIPVVAVVGRPSLSPLEEQLLARVDGRRSLFDIARISGLSLREILAVFGRFRDLGLIAFLNDSIPPQVVELEADDLLDDDS